MKNNHEENNLQRNNSRVSNEKAAKQIQDIKSVGLIELNSMFREVTCWMRDD